MPTENKEKTYLLLVTTVFTALQNATGQAPISNIYNAHVALNPLSAPPLGEWFITLIGPVISQQYYETQQYKVTAAEVAAFVNNHAGTAFIAANIVDVRRGNDTSYFEVETV